MHYLIDGHNLIAKLPDISLADPDDEAKLVLRLKSWAAGNRKRRVTVIFDEGLPGGEATNLSGGRVTVLFAGVGKSADSLLINHIRRSRNAAEYTLISSDRQIIAAAKAKRMPHWRSEQFVMRLAPPKPPLPSPPTSAPVREDPHLSEEEITEWLELFGPEPKPRPSQPKPPEKKVVPSSAEPKARPRRRPLSTPKTADRKLSPDEVAEWLKLFGQEEED